MKKARMALAAGLTPAFGLALAAPHATAAPRADHPMPDRPASTSALSARGKSVRLSPELPEAAGAAACASLSTSGAGQDGKFYALARYGKDCLYSVSGLLTKAQTGLQMRVRVYKGPGATNGIYSGYVHGTILPFASSTTFLDTVRLTGGKAACMALVNSKNHADVEYGPVCINY